MPRPRPRKIRPTLADVVDLLNVDDVVEPPSTLADLAEQHPDRADLALAYLRSRREGDRITPGRRAQVLYIAVIVIGIIVGLAAGIGLTSTVLHYDGTHPINILNALAWLVLLPALTMVLWAVAMLPSLPLLRPIQQLLRVINPGRLSTWLAARSNGAFGSTLAKLSNRHAPFAKLFKWFVATQWQWIAFGFHAGIVGMLSAMVAFTDLAFVWSTSLDIDPQTLHTAVESFAWLWRDFMPNSVPPLELVQASQYYQLDGGSYPQGTPQPAQLTEWWIFLRCATLFYGWFPRIAIFLFCVMRMRAAMHNTFRNAPETDALASAILARAVSTRATETEIAATDTNATANTTAVHNAIRVSWADADPNAPHQVGGGRTLADDAAAIETMTKTEGDIVIVVDAAEPPVLEFDDFVKALRKAIGDLRTIAVEPIDGNATQWAKAVARIGDSHLFLSEPRRADADSPASHDRDPS